MHAKSVVLRTYEDVHINKKSWEIQRWHILVDDLCHLLGEKKILYSAVTTKCPI